MYGEGELENSVHEENDTHIYQSIYDVFFSPVNPELGIIPSGQLSYSNFEYLNIPCKKLNVNDITEQQFL